MQNGLQPIATLKKKLHFGSNPSLNFNSLMKTETNFKPSVTGSTRTIPTQMSEYESADARNQQQQTQNRYSNFLTTAHRQSDLSSGGSQHFHSQQDELQKRKFSVAPEN